MDKDPIDEQDGENNEQEPYDRYSSDNPSINEQGGDVRRERAAILKDKLREKLKDKRGEAGKELGKKSLKTGAEQAGKELGKQAVAKGATVAAGASSGGTLAAAQVAAETAKRNYRIIRAIIQGDQEELKKRAAWIALAIWPFWLGLILVLLLIILIMMLFAIFAQEAAKAQDGAKLSIVKTGPESIPNPGTAESLLKYTITATYSEAASDITITDNIPAGTVFVSASGKYKLDPAPPAQPTTITWSALENSSAGPVATGSAQIFQGISYDLVLRPLSPNVNVVNQASGTVIPGTTSGSGGASAGYVAPSTNNCGGRAPTSPLGKNFGNPACNFSKDLLYSLLKEKDPTLADTWFIKIIPCESGYNPNAYAGPQTGTPDAAGAWGLYQMGSSAPPGSPPPAPGKNGPWDRGDVNWELQTSNAIEKGRLDKGNLTRYWACAR